MRHFSRSWPNVPPSEALYAPRTVSKASSLIALAFLVLASSTLAYALGVTRTPSAGVSEYVESCRYLPPDDLGHSFFFCQDADGNAAYRPALAR